MTEDPQGETVPSVGGWIQSPSPTSPRTAPVSAHPHFNSRRVPNFCDRHLHHHQQTSTSPAYQHRFPFHLQFLGDAIVIPRWTFDPQSHASTATQATTKTRIHTDTFKFTCCKRISQANTRSRGCGDSGGVAELQHASNAPDR